jgi:hypothetical protein
MNEINATLLKLSKRAETYDREHLIRTFVDLGPLFSILSNKDHEILYGRRGTGKTHALNYLASELELQGDIVVTIDMRTIGSNGGLFADNTVSLSERATRLLIDTISYIHEGIYSTVVNDSRSRFDLNQIGPVLDSVADAISEIRVIGSYSSDIETTESKKADITSTSGLTLGPDSIAINLGANEGASSSANERIIVRRSGEEMHRLHFATVHSQMQKLVRLLGGSRVWVLIDEWSETPIELQPFLAELLRRTLLPNSSITVKVAAIEQRARFKKLNSDGSYVGIEIGADIAASQNLDEYMVFDNDEGKSTAFFSNLVWKHFEQLASADLLEKEGLNGPQLFIGRAFTQKNAFAEFVRASEGVPRDAINVLGLAAQKANDDNISMSHVREAARAWYNRGKEKAIATNEKALALLRWIIADVIGERRARAFLLRADVKDTLIDYLFDSRLIHIMKENISSKDQPGVRYNAYSLDYGCYAELINTTAAPLGLMSVDNEEGEQEYVDVPRTDYRSIRRAVLNLDEFYNAQHTEG